jgi:[histone H3]-lysine36 N-trimethyltransferase
MNKYKHKIPRDDLKRFAKEIAKKLVASDFKSGRVKDPTKIDDKQQRKVKEYCKQFFDKAAHKHKKHEEERGSRKSMKGSSSKETPEGSPQVKPEFAADDEDIKMSDNELEDKISLTPDVGTPSDNQSLKRKRESPAIKEEDIDAPQSPLKKLHVETQDDQQSLSEPPPPPPPPPATDSPLDATPNGSTPGYERHGEEGDDADMEIDAENDQQAEQKLHAHGGESKFKEMSLADVKALAQMEGDGEDEVEW